LARLKKIGINLQELTAQLENEGVEKFNQPYDQLLQAIEEKKARTPIRSYAL
jgi:transaldolase